MPSSQFQDEELPALEEFFSRIGHALTTFADDFNLKIERYWHGFPSWRLNFKHPKSGVACIEVMKESDSEIKIYCYWWIDDFEKATRYSRVEESDVCRLDDVKLYELLKERLQLVLSWPINNWTDITTGYEHAWSCYKKEDFSRLSESYPVPRL